MRSPGILRKPIKSVKCSVRIVKIFPDHGNEVICFRRTIFFRVSQNHVGESVVQKSVCRRQKKGHLRFNLDWGNSPAHTGVQKPLIVEMPKLDRPRRWILILEEDAAEVSRRFTEGFFAPPFVVRPWADRIDIQQTLNPAICYSKSQIGSIVHAMDFAWRSGSLIRWQSECCLQDVLTARVTE